VIYLRLGGLARTLTTGSRRGLLAALAAGALASPLRNEATAEKRKKGKKRQPALQRNAFGCVELGKPCQGKDNNCCSGVCVGAKPKKGRKDASRCIAHDESSCLVGQNATECGGQANIACTTSFGAQGSCLITTGQAPYCAEDLACFPCRKDTDCLLTCQKGAACIACAGLCPDTGTACVGAGFCNH
jgi:hypothetical protein